MATNPSSFNPSENNPENIQNTGETSQRASEQISASPVFLTGYVNAPARVIVEVIRGKGQRPGDNINLTVKDINFKGPEVDIAPLFEELKQLKVTLKKILDTKQLSKEIGDELVGETYLRWDTQVRFYPTIVFIFLESEENYLKRSMLNKSEYRKKIQIKLRITSYSIDEFENNESFLKAYVVDLKLKISNLIDTYKFYSGNMRCTYVNQGSVSWKTTIFARDKHQAVMILTRLCNLIGERVNPRLFTSSTIRLANDMESDILVNLHKVSLLINKKKYPILLYHV